METYFLWNLSVNETAKTVSFFATQANIQRIKRGTKEMIENMLANLGIKDASFETWEINRFITNYMTADWESDDWEDSWTETWEIIVQLTTSIKVKKIPDYPIGTWETDSTWSSKDSVFPVECVIVADFENEEGVKQVKAFIENLQGTSKRNNSIDGEKISASGLGEESLENIRQELLKPGRRLPTIRQQRGYPNQLLISLGEVDETFWDTDENFIEAVTDLCEFFGGVTTRD